MTSHPNHPPLLNGNNKFMSELKLIHKGKVRDLYEAGEKYLLIVSSDRISAFDFILPNEITGKGKILNKLSLFWFEKTKHIIKNHIITSDIEQIKSIIRGQRSEVRGQKTKEFDWDYLNGRTMLVKKAKRIDFECIVRGYITGSGWKEYSKSGSICGIKLPAGLIEAQKLPEPIFTPSSKEDKGHDENVSFEQMSDVLGRDKAEYIKNKSIELYKFAAEYSEKRGIILADTKFEFGELDGEIILIDEIFTPDSSRFWDKSAYKTGTSPESFDKQFVRDWLEKKSGWDKNSVPPPLPQEVVRGTVARYKEALERIIG
ncbi:MAG: phosphoribosylaminoimidazolesuccinocarboxamide synthase [Elusimicrobia bacterium]|nr:phosphoribosylaminoimidazolesuccinocarboxamide synthase [Elusimicrobiota bacterium]